MSFSGLPAYRDLGPSWYAVMGIDPNTAPTYATPSEFAKAPADEAWVYSCVRRLYQSAQGVPLRVYVRVGKELVPTADEPSSEGDDLQALLDFVNPVDMSDADLKAFTVASYAVWGESFLKKVRGRFGGPPQELYWLRATDMQEHSPDGRNVLSWTHRPPQAEPEDIDRRNVVHFKSPNLMNPVRGLSPLSAARFDVATGRSWAEKGASSVNNDSVPPGYWQIPQNANVTEQDKRLVTRVLRALRGPRNRGKSPVMPEGIEFKAIALNPQDAEMIATRKISRMAVCAALGVPLVLAGDDEKNSVYANLRDAERVFWRGTMIPLLDGIASTLNSWLVPDFDPTRRRLVVAFDYSDIEALRPPLDVEWNAWINAISAQVLVPNQFIRHFRLGRDVPWGDRPIPRTAINLRPDPASMPPLAIPGSDPAEVAQLPAPAGPQPLAPEGESEDDVSESLRAFGRSLYRHPAVRAWTANPAQPLDTRALLGQSTSDATRLVIEAGLRRRDTAAVIAAALETKA